MRNKETIDSNDLDKILRHYESLYLFFDNIEDYGEKKQDLLGVGKPNISQFNAWLKNNNQIDRYTKLSRQVNDKSSLSFKCPVADMLHISLPNTGRDLINQAIHTIKAISPKYLVIDLRNCAGGDFNAALDFAGQLVPSGEICRLKFKNTESVHSALHPRIYPQKIFLFVNGSTMSSAEMLATTMYLNIENAVVIGSKTFGKCMGQSIMKLHAQDNIVFSMTAFQWDVLGNDSSIFDDCGIIERTILCESVEENDYLKHVFEIVGK